MTYSDIRLKLANITKPFFTDKFVEIYQNNISKYSENEIPIIMFNLSFETKEFIHNIIETPTEKLNKLYMKTNPKIIVCFYLRYWHTINKLKSSPAQSINLSDDPEALLKSLFFDFIETNSIIN